MPSAIKLNLSLTVIVVYYNFNGPSLHVCEMPFGIDCLHWNGNIKFLSFFWKHGVIRYINFYRYISLNRWRIKDQFCGDADIVQIYNIIIINLWEVCVAKNCKVEFILLITCWTCQGVYFKCDIVGQWCVASFLKIDYTNYPLPLRSHDDWIGTDGKIDLYSIIK